MHSRVVVIIERQKKNKNRTSMICVCGHKARNCERNGIKIINLLPAIISGLIMSNAMNATQQGIAMQFKNSHLLSRGILILWGREIK